MPWTTTHDVAEFLAAAGGFLRSRLVEHNVILTITARLPRAPRSGTFPRRSPTGWATAVWCCGKQAGFPCPWPGAPEVLLFTDATNPVTNSIYQRLGYLPAEDHLILTFY